MSGFDRIVERVRGQGRRIVLAEGHDLRVIEAAILARRDDLAAPILIGRSEELSAALLSAAVEIVDPDDLPEREQLADAFLARRAHKGATREQALAATRNPLLLAALLVQTGRADGTVGGAVATSSETIRASLQVLGCAPDSDLVSSFFLLDFAMAHHPCKGLVAFADCGLVVEPDVDHLTQIAISTADSYLALAGEPARIAMLSFSTYGSTPHSRAHRMLEATALVRQRRPDLMIDGELQFDAALIPEVAAAKAPHSPLAGRANVLVFPNLEAANIGYKIAQRLGGATAIGPIMQGLSRPANDLSRGCSAHDIAMMMAVTAAQALDRP